MFPPDRTILVRAGWTVPVIFNTAHEDTMMRNPCERCVYAIQVPESGLRCARSGGWYWCEDERALGWVAALAYHACGAGGRFFVERPEESVGRRRVNAVAIQRISQCRND